MGYPGDNDQPPWDNTPLETDPWSRHPLSAPVPQPRPEEQEAASWHGTESGSTSWGTEQPSASSGPSRLPGLPGQPGQYGQPGELGQPSPYGQPGEFGQPSQPGEFGQPSQPSQFGQPSQSSQPGSWLENAAAPPQPPAAPEWSEAQQPASWENDPLSAPPSFSGPSTGAQTAFAEPAGHGWQDKPLDGPSGPQPTPWQDPPPQPPAYEGYDNHGRYDGHDSHEVSTGTHALPIYDPQPSASQPPAVAFDVPGALSAQPHETPGGTQAFSSYDPPAYEAPNGALASQPFTGAQAIPPQSAWQEQPYEDRSGPQPVHQAPQEGQPSQAPYDGFSGPQQAAPWQQQGSDGFGPNEQWPPNGGSGFEEEGKGGSRKPLVFGGIVVLAAVLAGGVWVFKNNGQGAEKNASPSAAVSTAPGTSDPAEPATQPSSEAPAEGGLLDSRKTDPEPLTLGEVFRKKRFTEKGITYVMTIRKKSSCKDAVHGTTLQSALTQGKCTQFLRATFTTSGGKMIGTVGVANLATSAAAAKAAKAATAKDAYVVAVPAKGITSKIGQGDALGAAWTRGHYLIMTWVQLPNGKAIPAKYKKAAQTFAQSTVAGSNLGPALHIRDETGKPGA